MMNIFSGVYKSFEDAPSFGLGFSGNKWLESSKAKLERLISGKEEPLIYKNLLPFLAVLVHSKKKLIILDFGGGIGITYLAVSKSLPSKPFEYHIVENERICEEGGKIFKRDKRVIFHSQLPKLGRVDIVHIGSSLQYIGDWKKKLEELVAYKPRYFLFDDLHAGEIPTFVTLQNYYKSKIPCWFFNTKEVVSTMKKLNFDLIFKAKQRISYFGVIRKIPMENLPKKYRIGDTMCLLFRANAQSK